MRCATHSLNSLTCIARTLKSRLLRLIPQPSRATFGFCVNGTLLNMPGGRQLILRRCRLNALLAVSLSIGNCVSFTLEVNPHGGTTRDPDDYISRAIDRRASRLLRSRAFTTRTLKNCR